MTKKTIDWITLDKDGGSGNATVSVTVATFTGRVDRSKVISGAANGGSPADLITINQTGSHILNATASTTSIAATGGNVTISGSTNGEYIWLTIPSGATLSSAEIFGSAVNVSNFANSARYKTNQGASSSYSYSFTFTIPANQDESEKSYDIEVSIGGSSGSAVLSKPFTISQSAATKTYADPVITLSYPTMTARGTAVSPTISWTQTWGYNGATSGGGMDSGSTATSWSIANTTSRYSSFNTTSGAVTGRTLGTTITESSQNVGVVTATVTSNGKTSTKTYTVQQGANLPASVIINTSNVAIKLSKETLNAGSDSATVWYTGTPTINLRLNSGQDVAWSDSYGSYTTTFTPRMDSATGFSFSSPTITVSSRGTTQGAARSTNVRGKIEVTYTPKSGWGSSKSASKDLSTKTITQSANYVCNLEATWTGLNYSPSTIAYDASNSITATISSSTSTKKITKYIFKSGSTATSLSSSYGSASWGSVTYNSVTTGFSPGANWSTNGQVTASAQNDSSNQKTGTVSASIALTWNTSSTNSSYAESFTKQISDTATIYQSARDYFVELISASPAVMTANGGVQTLTFRTNAKTKFYIYTSSTGPTSHPISKLDWYMPESNTTPSWTYTPTSNISQTYTFDTARDGNSFQFTIKWTWKANASTSTQNVVTLALRPNNTNESDFELTQNYQTSLYLRFNPTGPLTFAAAGETKSQKIEASSSLSWQLTQKS